MDARHEPTLTAPFAPAAGLTELKGAADTTTLLPGSRILVRSKPLGHHGEINNKLKHLVFERLILWNLDGILFVATPDFELCIDPIEWLAEFWFASILAKFIAADFSRAVTCWTDHYISEESNAGEEGRHQSD